MSRQIKFELVAKNMSGKILREVYTLEELMDSSWQESFSVDIIAKRQFTGLLDKHGKEIYEGDIVKYSANGNQETEWGVAEIEFLKGGFVFNWLEQHTDKPSIFEPAMYFGCADELKIIGNIYQNKELLER